MLVLLAGVLSLLLIRTGACGGQGKYCFSQWNMTRRVESTLWQHDSLSSCWKWPKNSYFGLCAVVLLALCYFMKDIRCRAIDHQSWHLKCNLHVTSCFFFFSLFASSGLNYLKRFYSRLVYVHISPNVVNMVWKKLLIGS